MPDKELFERFATRHNMKSATVLMSYEEFAAALREREPRCPHCLHCKIEEHNRRMGDPATQPTPQPSNVGPCVTCGETTEWNCADCMIDTRMRVWLCPKRECREKHEATDCTGTPVEYGESQPESGQ